MPPLWYLLWRDGRVFIRYITNEFLLLLYIPPLVYTLDPLKRQNLKQIILLQKIKIKSKNSFKGYLQNCTPEVGGVPALTWNSILINWKKWLKRSILRQEQTKPQFFIEKWHPILKILEIIYLFAWKTKSRLLLQILSQSAHFSCAFL